MTNSSPPTISVVIVNFNAGDVLLQAVDSVLASSVQLELLVVDNASDPAPPLVSSDSLQLIRNEQNLGFAVANNQAIAQSRGDYILLLNPDCLVQPDTLERMLHTLEQYPTAGMAGCRILNEDGTEQRGCRRNLPTTGSGFARAFNIRRFNPSGETAIDLNRDQLPEQPVFVEAISGAFMLVKRAALEDVGPLDEHYFLHCEDLDWCKRFADKGWKILFVPDVEVVHRQGSCSNSIPVRVSWHKHVGMAKYYAKFLQRDRALPFNLLVYAGIYGRFLALAGLSALKKLIPSKSHVSES